MLSLTPDGPWVPGPGADPRRAQPKGTDNAPGGHHDLDTGTNPHVRNTRLAWFALVNHQPRQALELAQQGLTLAPNTSAGVQLAMQQARVWARLGRHRETEEALRAGATALARLPPPAHPEHHFAFDAPKLTFYAAMCFTWLHQTEQAEEHARQVITQSTDASGVIRWPTRFAVAQVDLALLAAQRGQPDEAALRGTAALGSGRVVASTLGWFADLDDLLLRDHGALPEVQDFHESYTAVRRSASQSANRR